MSTHDRLHIVLALGVALVIHIALFLVLTMISDGPDIRIEGGAISVTLGAAAPAAATPPPTDRTPDTGTETSSGTETITPQENTTPAPRETAAPQPSDPDDIPALDRMEPEPAAAPPERDIPASKKPEPKPSVSDSSSPPRKEDIQNQNAAAEDSAKTGMGPQPGSDQEVNMSAGAPDSSIEQADNATPGNAASDNYAGEVMRHLSRFRRPRASGPGSAIIVFTLTGTGEIASIEIEQSSGSPRFDRDALGFVEDAAPFPPPPPDVNRTFTVKIEGR
ncbi:TonB family protein [Parvularcula flava]|uniref:TonB family protein n=1 Tax=Aquisalinus luteolus TaxID=1566827 RepID=A0A8J3A276_9PROT|nr:TonB family protein [Aquisalinus luteolus]NHK27138.1 TonB family protein [Aquisalinus luteolus]GGH94515.1 hypothetical protein GCM10011355_08880 [Aquisalinus luteolus]